MICPHCGKEIQHPAKNLGSSGGKARARNLTPEQRSAIAKKAATKRWSNAKKK